MKNRNLKLGCLLLLNLSGYAQTKIDSIAKISRTEIEMVYNQYIQNGNNSAITGGIGPEKLTVYGPSFNIKKISDKNVYSYTIGSDIISSASTDNIDYIKSSASVLDARVYTNFGYERKFSKNLNLNFNGGLSIESDYLSFTYGFGISKTDKSKTHNYSFDVSISNDDLRWGLVNPGYYAPTKLIYPSELRYKEWYDVYNRNSYNFKLGLWKILNKRNNFGVFPELTYQEGLLATPFHRVYFSDGSLRVENLPNRRLKGAIAIRLNSFVAGNYIIKNTFNVYEDTFGIRAFSLENETIVKVNSKLAIIPNIRFYSQSSSKYFNEYLKNSIEQSYYTSDFDLSKFKTYNIGIGIKYKNEKIKDNRLISKSFMVRYNFLERSNNLNAHSISIIFFSSKD
ncbi:DUF3570 domain-containing protein [Flavobacterium yafengii]|uniref:DUF3570 domain-containing protein n=1 Tax=Flavobacterium yafengii TaxID=3041253 RepID=A0AAW6TLB6_9FLAO|nr:DUF3570 domain-containing protein [Flavobacterium yafengii]MDI5950382.1 DUF3570 domain-containing protein [Flavobacterium yafengii]